MPVWERVDRFVEQVNGLGAKTNRAELLAAWICSDEPDPEALKEAVERYRVATVRDVTPAAGPSATRTFKLRSAGRPAGT